MSAQEHPNQVVEEPPAQRRRRRAAMIADQQAACFGGVELLQDAGEVKAGAQAEQVEIKARIQAQRIHHEFAGQFVDSEFPLLADDFGCSCMLQIGFRLTQAGLTQDIVFK